MFSGTKGHRTKPPVGVRLNPLHPLSQGLVGCWLFNEGAGSVAHDLSGHGNHGTLKNMSPNAQNSGWGGNKFGGGLNFDGTGDHVDCGRGESLNIIDEFTLCAWCKPNGDYTTQQNIISKYIYSAGTDNQGYMLNFGQTDNEFMFYTMRNEAGSGLASSVSLADDNWHFIVATHDGTTRKIYFDGIIDVSQNYGLPIKVNKNLSIGGDLSSDVLNGSLDSVCIYNRALSAAEVKQLYEDPFCNLLRVPVRYAPAAPGGLSIPVAMNYYRRRRVA